MCRNPSGGKVYLTKVEMSPTGYLRLGFVGAVQKGENYEIFVLRKTTEKANAEHSIRRIPKHTHNF